MLSDGLVVHRATEGGNGCLSLCADAVGQSIKIDYAASSIGWPRWWSDCYERLPYRNLGGWQRRMRLRDGAAIAPILGTASNLLISKAFSHQLFL
jgi:hypothetical protein